MIPNIPSQSISGMGRLDIGLYRPLWPDIKRDSPCDQGLFNESRNLLLWFDNNRLRFKWPKRFGDHQELADEFAEQLQALIYSDFNQEMVEGLTGIRIPPLKVNVPAKSQVVMRARFATERLIAKVCEFTEGNRLPHYDDVVKLPIDIDPVRYSIADVGTQFFNNGRPLDAISPCKPDFIYAFDPRGVIHRGPPGFEGERHVLLLEHVQSRYLLDSLIEYVKRNQTGAGIAIDEFVELESGLSVPLSDQPGDIGYDEATSSAVRMFCKGFLESHELGRRFEMDPTTRDLVNS